MSGPLSCNTKDYATHQKKLDYSYANTTLEASGFDAKITLLNRFDFIIPKKGEKPVYCQMPYISGLAADGSGARVIFTTCGTMGCPTCGDLWMLQSVFSAAVHVEAYARAMGERPAHGQGSVNPSSSFTLDDIRKVGRSINGKLKRQGVQAGLKLFHGFRIKDDVKKALRQLTGSRASSGFWKFIRDDNNAGNVSRVNKILGTNYTDWQDCVYLAPHYHFVTFPGNAKYSGTPDLILKKEHIDIAGRKVWILRDTEATVKYLMYLISHASQLVNKKNHLKIISPFGGMFKQSAEKLLEPDELREVRLEVLEVLNRGRSKPLELEGDLLSYAAPKEEGEKVFYPMSEFRLTSLMAQENATAYVSGVRTMYGPDHANYVKYLIDTYNDLQECADVPLNFKRLFTAPFTELPSWVLVLPNDLRSMFETGIADPPPSFAFYSGGSLKI